MSHESSKAMKRRWREADAGLFPWRAIFNGRGLDVGAGDDPLLFPSCTAFDKQHGDANKLSDYFLREALDYIHASHCCEHLHSPAASIRDWITLLKPDGHIIATVPDVGAYERFTYPSHHNPDHKSSWSMIYKGSPFPIHCHIPTFLAQFNDVAEIKLMRYVEENYDWKLPPTVDQTWDPEKGCEIWCEFVIRKRP